MVLTNLKSRLMGVMPLASGKGKVIVAGMPKSGTTAIASLLAEAAAVDVCSDPFHQLDSKGVSFRESLFSGALPLEDLWRQHRSVFSGTVVKDPNFPLFLGELKQFLPEAQFVFIVREPRDNIRSILARLKIPGNPAEGNPLLGNINATWSKVLNGTSPDMPGSDYLEKMAWRWRLSAERYLENQERTHLIRYEDFRKDKKAQIEHLAGELGYSGLKDISSLVDIQYQPKGERPSNLEDFFGKENLQRIDAIVSPVLKRFGYE
ncbi:MAG: sulfotransferase family protein [Marinobacter sp.]|nr:MAG: sulfotransferase family protein [Marinobacter sp.]